MGVGSSFLDLVPEGGLEKFVHDLDTRGRLMAERKSDAAVVEKTEQPDGQILRLREDGSQQRVSKEGNTVETFPDGSVLKKTETFALCKYKDGSLLQRTSAGDTIEKFADGTQIQLVEKGALLIVSHADKRHVQWDLNTKSGTEEHPDGSTLEWNADEGNRVELAADGTLKTIYDDGCVITKFTDGRMEQNNPDGTRILTTEDGKKTQHNPDGSWIEFWPDGKRIDYRADGTVVNEVLGAEAKQAKASVAQEANPEYEDAEVSETDGVVAGAFFVRGARFAAPDALSTVEIKIFKDSLALIPYEMGVDVSTRDVVLTPSPAGKNAMKISYRIRLDRSECDSDMAQELHEELEESLTERGGTVFAKSLKRAAQELCHDEWLTDSVVVSFSKPDNSLTLPPSWEQEDSHAVQDTSASASGSDGAQLAEIARALTGGSSKSHLTNMRRKIKRATKMKTLQGSIKIKGISAAVFEGNNVYNKSLKEGLKEIFLHLGLNDSNLRIKLANVRNAAQKDRDKTTSDSASNPEATSTAGDVAASPSASSSSSSASTSTSVDYVVTLRGDAKVLAKSVVAALKAVFGDSKQRKQFITNYWKRIPAELGPTPSRRKKSRKETRVSKESKIASSSRGHGGGAMDGATTAAALGADSNTAGNGNGNSHADSDARGGRNGPGRETKESKRTQETKDDQGATVDRAAMVARSDKRDKDKEKDKASKRKDKKEKKRSKKDKKGSKSPSNADDRSLPTPVTRQPSQTQTLVLSSAEASPTLKSNPGHAQAPTSNSHHHKPHRSSSEKREKKEKRDKKRSSPKPKGEEGSGSGDSAGPTPTHSASVSPAHRHRHGAASFGAGVGGADLDAGVSIGSADPGAGKDGVDTATRMGAGGSVIANGGTVNALATPEAAGAGEGSTTASSPKRGKAQRSGSGRSSSGSKPSKSKSKSSSPNGAKSGGFTAMANSILNGTVGNGRSATTNDKVLPTLKAT